MPEVLLRGHPRRVRMRGVGVDPHQVAGMPAAHPGGLHAPRGGQVRRPQADALHARAGRHDLLDVGDAERGLQDGVQLDRARQPALGFELRQQAGPLDDLLG